MATYMELLVRRAMKRVPGPVSLRLPGTLQQQLIVIASKVDASYFSVPSYRLSVFLPPSPHRFGGGDLPHLVGYHGTAHRSFSHIYPPHPYPHLPTSQPSTSHDNILLWTTLSRD